MTKKNPFNPINKPLIQEEIICRKCRKPSGYCNSDFIDWYPLLSKYLVCKNPDCLFDKCIRVIGKTDVESGTANKLEENSLSAIKL